MFEFSGYFHVGRTKMENRILLNGMIVKAVLLGTIMDLANALHLSFNLIPASTSFWLLEMNI